MVRGRGNAANIILDTLTYIIARLDTIEITQRRRAHIDDVSDDEAVAPNPNSEPKENQDEERLLRVLSRAHLNPAIEVVPYDGKLDTNVMLDWISDMEEVL